MEKKPTNDTQTDIEQADLNWLENEATNVQQQTDYEDIPSMKFVEKKIIEVVVDFAKPFEKWTGEQSGKSVTKAIIPVMYQGQKRNWWLNVRNPVYRELILAGAKGQSIFKILQTGSQAGTRYSIVE